MREKPTRLVYSTDIGRIKPSESSSPTQPTRSDGIIRLHRETKGRKGKGVTLIKGLAMNEDELKTLSKRLKQKLGVGGAIKEGIIEIQSDNRDAIKALLEAEDLNVKLAGS